METVIVMTVHNNFATICPQTPLTAANAVEFTQGVNVIIEREEIEKVLINLQGVELIDSAAAVALVRVTRAARSQGKDLGLCGVNAQVRMVLELTQLDRFVHIYGQDVDLAVEHGAAMVA